VSQPWATSWYPKPPALDRVPPRTGRPRHRNRPSNSLLDSPVTAGAADFVDSSPFTVYKPSGNIRLPIPVPWDAGKTTTARPLTNGGGRSTAGDWGFISWVVAPERVARSASCRRRRRWQGSGRQARTPRTAPIGHGLCRLCRVPGAWRALFPSPAWSDKTNAKQRGVDWQFRIENARLKLKRLYPKIKT